MRCAIVTARESSGFRCSNKVQHCDNRGRGRGLAVNVSAIRIPCVIFLPCQSELFQDPRRWIKQVELPSHRHKRQALRF
jgi:hypothetical protein